jgi:hypothetical protein
MIMQSSSLRVVSQCLLYGKERIILAFAAYGLAAGIFLAIDANGYEPDFLDNVSVAFNFPSFIVGMMIFGEHYSIPVPIPVWNLFMVLGSVIVWTTIGFIIYCLYRLFKLGP